MHSEKTPDDGQRNCPKHVEFYSKNKFEKLVHLVGFIIRALYEIHIILRTYKKELKKVSGRTRSVFMWIRLQTISEDS